MTLKFWHKPWVLFIWGITLSSLMTGLFAAYFRIDLTAPHQINLGKVFLIAALIFSLFGHYSSWTWYGMTAHTWGIVLLEHLGVVQMSVSQQFVIGGITATTLAALVLLDYLNNGVPNRDTPQLI